MTKDSLSTRAPDHAPSVLERLGRVISIDINTQSLRDGIGLSATHAAFAGEAAGIRGGGLHAVDPGLGGVEAAVRRISSVHETSRALTITLMPPRAHTCVVRPASGRRRVAEWLRALGAPEYAAEATGEPLTVVSTRGPGERHAAIASTPLLATLFETAVECGWTDIEIRSSEDVIASAGSAGECIVIVTGNDGSCNVVHARGRMPVGARQLERFSQQALLACVHELQCGGEQDNAELPVLVIGEGEHARAIARILAERGHPTIPRRGAIDCERSTAEIIAQLGATTSPGTLILRSPMAQAAHEQRHRTAARWLSAAAMALLLGGYAIASSTTKARLAELTIARADMSARASLAKARYDSVLRASSVLEALGEKERDATRASEALEVLAVGWPGDASITTVDFAEERLTIEGEGRRTSAAYNALRGMPRLAGIGMSMPTRIVELTTGPTTERFVFNAHLRRARP